MKLLEIWVKAPLLRNSNLLIVSRCLKAVNPQLFKEISKEKVVLTACPEGENVSIYGKIASIIRSSRPKSITVVSIDGSPHCLQLHAAVNEAVYILGERIPKEHYVVLDGEKLIRISPEAVRVARYLSLVDKLLRKNTDILKELEKHSLEYSYAKKMKDVEL